MSLNGKHALITGSSRGIGRGIAVKLAQKGARIAINYYKNEASAKETLEMVRAQGSDGFIVQSDVIRAEEMTRMCQTVAANLGALDIFVSNALFNVGTVLQAPMEVTPEKWDIVLNSQVRAFLTGCQESNHLMRDGGRIVAIGYNPGTRTGSWQPYVTMGAAKAALEAVCRYVAVALANRGITVNVISPGFTEDTFLNTFPEDTQNAIRSWHENGWTPMGRLARPGDIAGAVALLCSDDAAWITGQIITADGGASLMNSDFPLEVQLGPRSQTRERHKKANKERKKGGRP